MPFFKLEKRFHYFPMHYWTLFALKILFNFYQLFFHVVKNILQDFTTFLFFQKISFSFSIPLHINLSNHGLHNLGSKRWLHVKSSMNTEKHESVELSEVLDETTIPIIKCKCDNNRITSHCFSKTLIRS